MRTKNISGLADVIDFAGRTRCRAEARGMDSAAVAAAMFAETGNLPASWDYDPDPDPWDCAA